MRHRILFGIFLLLNFQFLFAQQFYYKGELVAQKKYIVIDSGDTHEVIMAFASLYADSVKDSSFVIPSQYGSIALNGIGLRYDTTTKIYSDTVVRNPSAGMIWNFVSTSTAVPGFSLALADSFPSIPSYTILPSLINKNQNLSVNFGSVAFADQVEFKIYDENLNLYTPYNRLLGSMDTSVLIPTSDLAYLTGGSGFIGMIFSKNHYTTVNGVNYKIVRRLCVLRPVSITP